MSADNPSSSEHFNQTDDVPERRTDDADQPAEQVAPDAVELGDAYDKVAAHDEHREQDLDEFRPERARGPEVDEADDDTSQRRPAGPVADVEDEEWAVLSREEAGAWVRADMARQAIAEEAAAAADTQRRVDRDDAAADEERDRAARDEDVDRDRAAADDTRPLRDKEDNTDTYSIDDYLEEARRELEVMAEQARLEVAEMIRRAQAEGIEVPDAQPRDWETDDTPYEDYAFDDRDAPDDSERDDADSGDRYQWRWDTDNDADVESDGELEHHDDEYWDIPVLTREAVAARTEASREYTQDLVSRKEPVRPGDYSQEIRPLDEMPKGGALHLTATHLEILRAEDIDRFATEWQAHIERTVAARYAHAYAKDANPQTRQGLHDLAKATLSRPQDDRLYFQEALVAVNNGRCDPDQLRIVLNELHPGLRHHFGFYQPPARDALPFYRDSALTRRPSRQLSQAKDALAAFVQSLPDKNHYPAAPRNTTQTAAVRLRAETELFRRTTDHRAPPPIQGARLHRLATALQAPKITYEPAETPSGQTLEHIPMPIRLLYHRARVDEQSPRTFRLWR